MTAGFSHAADAAAFTAAAEMMTELDLRCSDVLVAIAGDPQLAATARRLGALGEAVGAPVCVAAVASLMTDEARGQRDLAETARIVADHGMRLAIEFLPYSPLATMRMAVGICDAIGWHRCGLVVDSLHFYRAQTPLAELLALDPEQIALIQYSDAPREAPLDLVNESRHGRLLPGHGGLPLREWVQAVKTVGYEGAISGRFSLRRCAAVTRSPLYKPAAEQWRRRGSPDRVVDDDVPDHRCRAHPAACGRRGCWL